MQTTPAARIPFDLAALPEGFRRNVEKAYSPKAHREPHEALLWALSSAWGQSTAKQRHAAEDGVNRALAALLADRDASWRSYAVGVIGGTCLDLAMRFFDWDQLEDVAVLRGIQDAGGIRVNSAMADWIDNLIKQAPAAGVIVDATDLLAVDVCSRTIPLPNERRDLEDGIRQAFMARPQRGTWRVSVIGENDGNSDRLAFTFSRAGAGGGSAVDLGTLVCNISDLHNGGAGGGPRERLIAEVRASIDLWLRERGTPAPKRSALVRPSGNIVEFVTEPDTSLANARKRDLTYMVDRWLSNHGVTMANVKLAFEEQGSYRGVQVVEAWGRYSPEGTDERITDLVQSILRLEADLPKRLGYVRICVAHHEEPMRDYYYCSGCAFENPPVWPGATLEPPRDYWEITEEQWDACKRVTASPQRRYAILRERYKLTEGTLRRSTVVAVRTGTTAGA